MAENEKTDYFDIVKPNPLNNMSEEVLILQQAFDIIDGLFRAVALDLLKKMDKNAELAISDIGGLAEALNEKMAKSRKFALVEMTDVVGVENALDNYILTKAGNEFVLRSALAVIGAHTHDIANIVGLQPILNTLVSGPTGVIEGEIAVFQGASGKALQSGSLKLSELLLKSGGVMTGMLRIRAALNSYAYHVAKEDNTGNLGGIYRAAEGLELYLRSNDEARVTNIRATGISYLASALRVTGGDITATGGKVTASGDINAGNGSGVLEVNGNVRGEAWLPWGSASAVEAIESRIQAVVAGAGSYQDRGTMNSDGATWTNNSGKTLLCAATVNVPSNNFMSVGISGQNGATGSVTVANTSNGGVPVSNTGYILMPPGSNIRMQRSGSGSYSGQWAAWS